MSFNKRYFSRDSIIARYKSGGVDAVILSFAKIDSAIFDDRFSSKVGDAVWERNRELINKLIQDEINMDKGQAKDELIKLYENQIMDLTVMSKIELGDDVIAEIKRLKAIIAESFDQSLSDKIESWDDGGCSTGLNSKL